MIYWKTPWLVLCTAWLALAAQKTDKLECMFLGYPDLEYDGFDRTEVLTEKNFNKTVFAEDAKSVVFFNDVEEDDPELDQYECFMQIPDDPVTIINDEHDLEEFEDLEDETVRVVGYFEPGSAALKEFEEAAEEFMGEIEFFAVVTSKWARKVGLKRIGEIQMLRPFEEDPLFAPSSADTGIFSCRKLSHYVCLINSYLEEEIEDWVEKHKEPVMQKLTLENYFNVWRDPEQDERLILAFVDEETREGRAMKKLLDKIADENSEHAGTLEIVLIDPDEFPLMVDVWEEMFGIDIEEGPQIGLVDISEIGVVHSTF
uniref:Calsequestrin n=1 Tax=Angiostrongylus cantonensis TaxID=6313 RepID=A0A0K0DQH7_ANGCA